MSIPDSAIALTISDERDRLIFRTASFAVRTARVPAAGGTKLASKSFNADLRAATDTLARSARSRNDLPEKVVHKRSSKAAPLNKIIRAQNEMHRRAAAKLLAAADKSAATKTVAARKAAGPGTGADAAEENMIARVTYHGKRNVVLFD